MDAVKRMKMTEHKFGTWYPIEELTVEHGDVLVFNRGDALNYSKYGISKGYKRHKFGGVMYLYEDIGETESGYGQTFNGTHFMPLPPRPGDE
jgi:hypothetical protein